MRTWSIVRALLDLLRRDSWCCAVMWKTPLYIREESKKLLQASLFNDTLFLASLNVM